MKGTSPQITVSANVPDQLRVLTSISPIIVGKDRVLQVRLEDQYTNPISAADVTFSLTSSGNGSFSEPNPATTTANGVAEITYTASSDVTDSPDIIHADYNSGAVTRDISLTLINAPIAYFELVPSVLDTTAGSAVQFIVTAYDEFNNVVVNNTTSVVEFLSSSPNVQISPSDSTLTNGVTGFTATDNVAENYTLTARLLLDPQKRGQSGIITIRPDTLNYVVIRTAAFNEGQAYGDTSVTADGTLSLYAAGYDRFDNYRNDVIVNWGTTGTLDPFTSSGKSWVFSPATAPASGQITATSLASGVTPDSTGTITVTTGTLAEIRIQTERGDGGSVVSDSSLTTDELLILYASAYDGNGNYLNEIASTWTMTGSIGAFITANSADSIIFDPRTVGRGTIRATTLSNPLVYDITGLLTITAGAIDAIVVRNAPGGSGTVVDTDTIIVGGTLVFYSAGYDADNNYVSDMNVDWHQNGTLTGLVDSTDISRLVLSPVVPGIGYIFTSNASGWTNDSTGTIVIRSGQATQIVIRSAPNNGGIAIDTLNRAAGDSVRLYAAFYDYQNNYLGDQPVLWSVQGDSIGYFGITTPSDTNRFYFTKVNSAIFTAQSGLLTDNSGLVRVHAGAAYNVQLIAGTNQTGEANTFLLVDPEVRVVDAFDNAVPGIPVQWSTPTNGSLTPPIVTTNTLGLASSNWRLKSTLGPDTAYAVVNVIADTATFFASVLSSSADSMLIFSAARDTNIVTQSVTNLVVQVVDSLSNPVANAMINFAVDSLPSGGGDFVLGATLVLTDTLGLAQTTFTLGSRSGTYRIQAYNGLLKGSPVTFRRIALPDAANRIAVYSGNQQSGIVGNTLSLNLVARVLDQYNNPVSSVNVDWTPTADGDTTVISNVSNANGLVSTQWILRTNA
ncbi:MAG: hypothetical protein E4H13_13125, partial [Calditrichales bacterium]